MKIFPTLYKKTSIGAIQFWTICVDTTNLGFNLFPEIEIRYGQLGTDSPQITFEHIKEGKNIGKANETTPMEQAIAEAQARWEKQLKKGYVDSIDAAKANELNDLIEGGILPMLAHTFEKQGHKIKYPCYVQPKLDGIRCIAILKEGKCTLWSRSRKQITSCPHIVNEIEKNFKEDIVLDGELYNHDFKDNFEHIVHLVRQEEPDSQCTDVTYNIYDIVDYSNNFKDRYFPFHDLDQDEFQYLKAVATFLVEVEENVAGYFNMFKNHGYEGAILRNANSFYVNKRSYDLQKVKEMQDDEFEIIGISEGKGRLAGHAGAFICRTKDGTEFNAKMSGSTERLREYFLDHSLWQGRLLVVQYQDLTSYNIPRFPVGLRLKEEV